MPVPFFVGVTRYALSIIALAAVLGGFWAIFRLAARQEKARASYRYWWIDPRVTIAVMFSRDMLIFVILLAIAFVSILGVKVLG